MTDSSFTQNRQRIAELIARQDKPTVLLPSEHEHWMVAIDNNWRSRVNPQGFDFRHYFLEDEVGKKKKGGKKGCKGC